MLPATLCSIARAAAWLFFVLLAEQLAAAIEQFTSVVLSSRASGCPIPVVGQASRSCEQPARIGAALPLRRRSVTRLNLLAVFLTAAFLPAAEVGSLFLPVVSTQFCSFERSKCG